MQIQDGKEVSELVAKYKTNSAGVAPSVDGGQFVTILLRLSWHLATRLQSHRCKIVVIGFVAMPNRLLQNRLLPVELL